MNRNKFFLSTLKSFTSFFLLVFTMFLLFSAPMAKANIIDDAKQVTKKAVKKTKKAATKATKEVKKVTKKAVDATGKAAKQTGKAISSVTKKTTDKVVEGTEITVAEMQKLGEKTKKTWDTGIKAAEKGYLETTKQFNKLKQDVLLPIYRKAGDAAIAKNKEFINNLNNRMMKLDKEGRDARDRIIRALPDKKITKKMREDMQILGKKLGLVAGEKDSILPNKVEKSSWGIYGSLSGGAIVGAEISPSIIMNTFVDKNGKYPVGLAVGGAGSIGLQGGGSGQIGLFWSPGSVDKTSGTSVGLGFEAALGGVGAAIGVSWSVDKNLFKEAVNAVPGFNLGWSMGVKAKVGAVSVGYTHLITKF